MALDVQIVAWIIVAILTVVMVSYFLYQQLHWRTKNRLNRRLAIEALTGKRIVDEETKLEPLRVELSKLRGDRTQISLAHETRRHQLEQAGQPTIGDSELARLAQKQADIEPKYQEIKQQYRQAREQAQRDAQKFAREAIDEMSAPLVVINEEQSGLITEGVILVLLVVLCGLLAITGMLDPEEIERLVSILIGYLGGRGAPYVLGNKGENKDE